MPRGSTLRYVNFRASRGRPRPIDEPAAAPDYCSIVNVPERRGHVRADRPPGEFHMKRFCRPALRAGAVIVLAAVGAAAAAQGQLNVICPV
jgi:hypothetical protein